VNPLHIEKCGFYNTKALYGHSFGIIRYENKGEHTLEKCVFSGLDFRGSEAINSNECLIIDGCSFDNCKIGYHEDNDGYLVRLSSTSYGGFLNKKKVGQEIYAKVRNCQNVKIKKYFDDDDDDDDEGAFLTGQRGSETSDVPVMRKTAKGENIGTTVDPEEVGVPGFDPLSA
jgi:hypothetical protein